MGDDDLDLSELQYVHLNGSKINAAGVRFHGDEESGVGLGLGILTNPNSNAGMGMGASTTRRMLKNRKIINLIAAFSTLLLASICFTASWLERPSAIDDLVYRPRGNAEAAAPRSFWDDATWFNLLDKINPLTRQQDGEHVFGSLENESEKPSTSYLTIHSMGTGSEVEFGTESESETEMNQPELRSIEQRSTSGQSTSHGAGLVKTSISSVGNWVKRSFASSISTYAHLDHEVPEHRLVNSGTGHTQHAQQSHSSALSSASASASASSASRRPPLPLLKFGLTTSIDEGDVEFTPASAQPLIAAKKSLRKRQISSTVRVISAAEVQRQLMKEAKQRMHSRREHLQKKESK